MADVPTRMQRRLEALEQLKAGAAPSDLAFYQATEQQAKERLKRAEEPQAPATPEALRAELGGLWGYVQGLEHDLTQPERVEHSHQWARDKLPALRAELERLHTELRALDPNGPPHQAPTFDPVLHGLSTAYGEVRCARIAAELMRDLHAAWMEREGRGQPEHQARLAQLEREAAEALDQETAAIGAIEAHQARLNPGA